MKRPATLVFLLLLFLSFLLLSSLLRAQQNSAPSAAAGRTLVVIPFENTSPTPGLEWLGESFPETLHAQLDSPALYVASREDRLRAYDRQGVPSGLHPSRATIYRLAEQMDVDYVALGTYHYDGTRLTATSQLLDMRAQKLFPAVTESEPLANLGTLQSAIAWDLLRVIRPDFAVPKDKYIAAAAPVRLDALEHYIRGTLATTADAKISHYREAVRLSPDYSLASLELGKTYYAQRSYEPAIAALSQVSRTSAVAREANFYLGLAAYAHGDFARAESAFDFVAARLPLAEVYNNLGATAARRGQKKASEYFARAVQNDPSDADYHFNLGASLAQSGDRAGAARELRATLELRAGDGEARSLLDSLTTTPSSVVPSAATTKIPAERIKRNYEESSFRQVAAQMTSWAEERFARSDPRTHARFHLELGKELMAHGFTTDAEAEFRHAAAVDPGSPAPLTALAEDLDARGDAAGARAQAEAALRLRESVDAYLILARLDLRENRADATSRNIDRALQLDPNNAAALSLKRALASKLAERSQ